MPKHFDVIIAGGGTMGCAAAYYLRNSGLDTLLIEQFPTMPHTQGSHTGQSRIIRKAYFEHENYVPLLELAYDEWHKWELRSGKKLFIHNGLLYAGPWDHPLIQGVLRSAHKHRIEVHDITAQAAAFPFTFPADYTILHEPNAGFVLPEKAISIFLNESLKKGCAVSKGEKVINFEKDESGFLVTTDVTNYHCDKLVITAGAWTQKLLAAYRLPLKVTRQLIVWVKPEDPIEYEPQNFPCWMIGEPHHTGVYYGFPYLDGEKYPGPTGLKYAFHHPAVACDPDAVDRTVTEQEIAAVVDPLKKYLPVAASAIVDTKTCLYTNTPDEHFIIDHLPEDKNLIIACGFSGHGFKFAPAIGKILAEMVHHQKPSVNIDFLSLNRFPRHAGY